MCSVPFFKNRHEAARLVLPVSAVNGEKTTDGVETVAQNEDDDNDDNSDEGDMSYLMPRNGFTAALASIRGEDPLQHVVKAVAKAKTKPGSTAAHAAVKAEPSSSPRASSHSAAVSVGSAPVVEAGKLKQQMKNKMVAADRGSSRIS